MLLSDREISVAGRNTCCVSSQISYLCIAKGRLRVSAMTQKTHSNIRSFDSLDMTSPAALDRAFFSLVCQVTRYVVGRVLGILHKLTCSRGYRPHQRVAVLVHTMVPHCHAVTHCVAVLLAHLARLAVQVCVVVLVLVRGTDMSLDYAITRAHEHNERRNKAHTSNAPSEQAASQD